MKHIVEAAGMTLADVVREMCIRDRVGDGQIAVLGAEPVEPGIEGAQGQDLLMFRV